jgi:hypothetical protein
MPKMRCQDVSQIAAATTPQPPSARGALVYDRGDQAAKRPFAHARHRLTPLICRTNRWPTSSPILRLQAAHLRGEARDESTRRGTIVTVPYCTRLKRRDRAHPSTMQGNRHMSLFQQPAKPHSKNAPSMVTGFAAPCSWARPGIAVPSGLSR